MTNNTITNNLKNGFSTIASEMSERAMERTLAAKKRAGVSLRKIVAVALFTAGTFLSLGSTVNLALAKARKAGSRMAHSGSFRLLNIYNSLKSANPAFIEAMNKATTGLASWYGGIFHGRRTAMGTTYNMYAMTAAHRSLPLGTWVKVTNERNGKSAIVQVTDRGPYVANRIMDLSYAAAQKLGYANSGTTQISMKVLGSNPDGPVVADADTTSVQGASMQGVALDTVGRASVATASEGTASIAPALFSNVSARTDTESLSAPASNGISSIFAAITDFGSPLTAIAEMLS